MTPTDRPAAPALCARCGLPEVVHLGYNHGAGKCLVAKDWIDLRLKYSTEAEAKDVVRRVNAWWEDQQRAAP